MMNLHNPLRLNTVTAEGHARAHDSGIPLHVTMVPRGTTRKKSKIFFFLIETIKSAVTAEGHACA